MKTYVILNNIKISIAEEGGVGRSVSGLLLSSGVNIFKIEQRDNNIKLSPLVNFYFGRKFMLISKKVF